MCLVPLSQIGGTVNWRFGDGGGKSGSGRNRGCVDGRVEAWVFGGKRGVEGCTYKGNGKVNFFSYYTFFLFLFSKGYLDLISALYRDTYGFKTPVSGMSSSWLFPPFPRHSSRRCLSGTQSSLWVALGFISLDRNRG